MNIALVVYSHYSRDARVRRYAESLARNGHKVDVVSLQEDYKPEISNISLIMYPLPRRRFGRAWYVVEYFTFFLYSLLILSANFFRKRYQVIHVNNMPEVLAFAAFVPKLFGAKIILDMHDPMPELYMSKFHAAENSFMVKWLKGLERISFNFADYILTANPEFKKMFLHRNPTLGNKLSVILNCPDPNIFNIKHLTFNNKPFAEAQGKHFTLLYMGTVEKRFGLDIAIEAIPKLVKKIPNLRFIIIPKLEEEGEYLKNLKFEIQNLKLDKYIHILQPLPLEKIAGKLKEADVGIVLAKNGVFTESIFPVKLLEFIQMNVPVIASKTKTLSRYFNGRQIYFLKKNTPKEFGKAVTTLHQNKVLRENLSQNAKLYLQKYNWKKEERKYLGLIKKEKRQIPVEWEYRP